MTSAWPSALVAVAAALAVLVRHGSLRKASGAVLGAVAAVSVATTVAIRLTGVPELDGRPDAASQVEVVALLALMLLAARDAGGPSAAVGIGLAAVAVGAIVLRPDPEGGATAVLGAGVWALASCAFAGAGLFLRRSERRRIHSVSEAQEAQRRYLAHDLHDFVAHDVSEMLALARAGQVVAAGHPGCSDAFGKIEEAAQRALRSMDQTIEVLRTVGTAAGGTAASGPEEATPRVDVALLSELVERFGDAQALRTRIVLDGLDADELAALPGTASATLYRVTVEALTNVRRHAAGASSVTLRLRAGHDRGGATIEVVVEDDGRGGAVPPRGRLVDGLGLPSLRDRVERLGGSFSAGAMADGGWRVSAVLPRDARAPR